VPLRTRRLLGILTLLAIGCSASHSTLTNPCDLLSREQVAHAVGVKTEAGTRVPAIGPPNAKREWLCAYRVAAPVRTVVVYLGQWSAPAALGHRPGGCHPSTRQRVRVDLRAVPRQKLSADRTTARADRDHSCREQLTRGRQHGDATRATSGVGDWRVRYDHRMMARCAASRTASPLMRMLVSSIPATAHSANTSRGPGVGTGKTQCSKRKRPPDPL
jgi:hypothetical protein